MVLVCGGLLHGIPYQREGVNVGYCMDQEETEFFVSKDNLLSMMEAIRALHGKETITDSGGRHFSWVDHKFHTITDPIKMLRAWRWDAEQNQEGNIDFLHFRGEKYGDDPVLFQAIAPFVRAGSYIQMRGEDGGRWRWCFDGQKMTEQQAKATWGQM
jgi:hypothetical protein